MDDFNRLLEEYKNQYLQFLATGEESYKRAYQTALEAIENAVSSKRDQLDTEKGALKHFAASYAKTNKELESVVQDGLQDAHDQYTTSKNRFNEWTANPVTRTTVDVSTGYIILLRFGILLILLPVLLFVGLVMPFQFEQSQSVLSSMQPMSP